MRADFNLKASRPEYLSLAGLYKSCISLRAAPLRLARTPPIDIPHQREHHMSFYDATVPAFLQILGSLSGTLGKAEAHCKAKNIQPDVLLGARLYPDMLPLSRQVQMACDFATKTCARLTQNDVPSNPDTEKSFDDLKARLGKNGDYV